MSNNFVTYPGIQEMYIGKPIPNVSGPFAGRTIRSQLEECQKPDLGRKFAKRDRRPVDPPPVIRLRMFEVLDEGTENQREEELPAESIETIGLVAHVDLFAAKPPPRTGFGSLEGAMQISPNSEYNSYNRGIGGQQDQIDESLLVVDENEVLTSAAFGSTFAHAVTIRDLKGESVVYFVFPDISVKIEGHFVLRYRCCNLRSRVAGSDDVPIMAELRSGVFEIYSTKEFPGLRASTDLTKHLSLCGIRVNLRENSRGRRNRRTDEDGDEDENSSGGGEIVDEEHGIQFYDPGYLDQQTQVVFGPPQPHRGAGSYEYAS